MNFIKKYWTHSISISFFLCYIVIFSAYNYIKDYIMIFDFMALILVIGIWGEIIYFIVKAAKSDELKNKWLNIIFIYLFNVFYIPHFYLKYIYKDEKATKKNGIFIGITLVLLIICIVSIFKTMLTLNTNTNMNDNINQNIISSYNTYSSKDEVINITISSKYKQESVGEYDLYFSGDGKVVGIFLYNDTEKYDYKDILDYKGKYIIDTREDGIYVDEKIKSNNRKTIVTRTYKAKNNGNNFVYKLSTISFDEKENYIVFVIQIVEEIYYEDDNKELEEILESINLNKKTGNKISCFFIYIIGKLSFPII